MYDTQVTLVGNLVADPRIHTLPDGQVVASFRIASTRRRFDRSAGQWRDFGTTYANVTCWRGLGENAAASLKKGQAAIVWGRLSVRPYETRDGGRRESVDIEAFAVGPDLSRVITLVKRAERSVGAAQPDAWTAAIPEHEATRAERPDASGAETADDDLADDLIGELRENFEDFDETDNEADDELELDDGAAADRTEVAPPTESSGDEFVGVGIGAGAGASGGRLKARFGIG